MIYIKTRVAVLYGGKSSEREVSLETGKEVINALDKDKYQVIDIEIPSDDNRKWIKKIIKNKIDLAIIALHGGIGENGSIQGLLECLNIPYIGSKVLGSALGMNKYIAKQLLSFNNIDVPTGIYLESSKKINDYEISKLNYPLVVKPNEEGSSVGVTIVNNVDELKRCVERLEKDILIEEYINGTEVTCGVIENNDKLIALDVLEIKSTSDFYDYKAKYEDDTTVIKEAILDKALIKEIKEVAIMAFKTLKAKDYARIDMIIKDKNVYVLEINTLPGMTPHSLIPKSLNLKGISYSDFLDSLINSTLYFYQKI